MTDLTNDEITCLAIMNDGANMLAIGRWKQPIEHLVELGLARRIDQHNYIVTKEGNSRIENYDQSQSDSYLRIHNEIVQVRTQASGALEQAAKLLAEACAAQHRLSGEVANQVTFRFGQEIIKRALEILGA